MGHDRRTHAVAEPRLCSVCKRACQPTSPTDFCRLTVFDFDRALLRGRRSVHLIPSVLRRARQSDQRRHPTAKEPACEPGLCWPLLAHLYSAVKELMHRKLVSRLTGLAAELSMPPMLPCVLSLQEDEVTGQLIGPPRPQVEAGGLLCNHYANAPLVGPGLSRWFMCEKREDDSQCAYSYAFVRSLVCLTCTKHARRQAQSNGCQLRPRLCSVLDEVVK